MKKTGRVFGSGTSQRTRRLQPSWYKSHPWLHFCCTTLKLYCHYCKAARKRNIRLPVCDPAFSIDGFCNWKKATTRFKEHELSRGHRLAYEAQVSNQAPINAQLQNEFAKMQKTRRNSLVRQVSALRYLLRQGLAVRNDHAGGSNLTVLLQTVLDEDKWVEDGRYESPEIINELMEIMAHEVLRSMLTEIFSQKCFALLADETRDISNREQLVMCVRWVSESYNINEDLVGLIQVSDTTAETIYRSLDTSLVSLGFRIENCRGQGYDGASNFQGHVSGVGKRFLERNPAAIPVHCLAHCVNLYLQDVARDVTCIKDGLNFAMELIQLIKLSPKRQVLFETIKAQQEISTTPSIRSLCPTRWTVRTRAMQSILLNYEILQSTMEQASYGTDDCSRRAGGVVAVMARFLTFFGLKLSVLLFSYVEQLSISLQGIETTVNDCYYAADLCIKAFERIRTEDTFTSFFRDVEEQAAGMCGPPVLPRRRRLPRRIDDGGQQHHSTTIEDMYRVQYFKAIDCVKEELKRRFQQTNFLFVRDIESMLISSANGKSFSIPQKLKELYGKDLDCDKLSLQLQMLPDAIKQDKRIKQVTKIQTICDILNDYPAIKRMLSEVHTLLKIYYTVPVTTASAERSFSGLKRIKTYLRNSMTQARLNHCMLMHVHQSKMDSLDTVTVAKEFIGRKERRIALFGKF